MVISNKYDGLLINILIVNKVVYCFNNIFINNPSYFCKYLLPMHLYIWVVWSMCFWWWIYKLFFIRNTIIVYTHCDCDWSKKKWLNFVDNLTEEFNRKSSRLSQQLMTDLQSLCESSIIVDFISICTCPWDNHTSSCCFACSATLTPSVASGNASFDHLWAFVRPS